MDEVWAGLDAQDRSADDPITAFAPNSRMYWGPGEGKLKKRRFKRS